MATTTTAPLTESAGEVFAQLARLNRATRPQLAAACALSKPTVSSAMAELESAGLVARDGTAHGSTGRSAAVYRLAADAGYVLAVDRGHTQVSFRAIALDGTVLDEGQSTRLDRAWSMLAAARRRRTADGPLRRAVVAVSDVVLPDPAADPETARRVADAVESLRLPGQVPVAVENNVNCAAIAELHDGDGSGEGPGGRDTFVYLQVGVGIGAGIVIGRRLLRGRNGAAGEVARLAYPWADGREPGHEALEARIGSPGLMLQVSGAWRADDGPLPADPEAVFALAAEGHPRAAALVARHAAEVGKLAVSLTAVLDPGLVILGGGVGRNPLLTAGVAETLARLGWPTKLEVSRLGEHATVLGAAHLAREHGINAVVTGA
ncbi:ROK family transcriptional regulator [Actinospica sp. MGRD01-02]|uniref:ROK family transcriptional regulator n=1 Tax=Actinospica acidithermotolerans TaxID=2828514 RepID=A0A941EEA8_9ACTN|nr:ROK family transcriptional regulator [Actinospica acidithermotolerans]MBR7829787.1 ROK family transcriptional regulator [Actinospica acidithermotolerans]